MTRSIFGPPGFSPKQTSRHLGEEAAPISITRDLAEIVNESIRVLVFDPGSPEVYTREACWRDLRSRRWGHVEALRRQMTTFLATQDKELQVSDSEWELIESVVECVEAIGSLEKAGTTSTLETAGAVVGVIGGLAALVAIFI
jgi:hypothetical protein